jgi:hypothetical protein
MDFLVGVIAVVGIVVTFGIALVLVIMVTSITIGTLQAIYDRIKGERTKKHGDE